MHAKSIYRIRAYKGCRCGLLPQKHGSVMFRDFVLGWRQGNVPFKRYRVFYQRTKWLVCLLLQLVAFGNVAQTDKNLRFHHLTISDGLSNNSVRCILQDSQGFMWFGTYNGLNRYDGYNFEVFRHQLREQYTIADNLINFLYEDSREELWIATNSGLSKYDRKYNRFISYDTFEGNIINAIWEDGQKDLWLSSYNFIYKLDRNSNQFTQYPPFTDAIITSAITLADNTFLIGTHKAGLFHIDFQAGKIKQYLNNVKDKSTLCHNEITSLKLENDERVWVSTRNGLDVFNIEKSTFTHIGRDTDPQKSLLSQSIRCNVHFKGGEVWVGTQKGISIVDLDSNLFRHHVASIYEQESLSDESIWAIKEDKQGRIWIGTYSGGINVLDPLREQFTDDVAFQENGAVNSILEDSKGRLWAGTENGIVMKDGTTRSYFFHTPNQLSSIPANTILTIFEDNNRNIWVGSWNGGLSKFDVQTRAFVTFEVDPQNPVKLASRNIYDIAQSSANDQLLIASFDGFHILTSEAEQTFLNYKHNVSDQNSLSANFCRVVFEDSKKNIWIGTDKGFNHFDIQTETFARFIHKKTDTSTISNNYINSIFEDGKNRLWIGTANGLNLMTAKDEFRVYLNPDDSFNYIQSILEDENGDIWLSTISGGISRFSPTSENFHNYDEFSSPLSNEFRSNSSHKGRDGKLYFGGVKGLCAFHPDGVKKNQHITPVFFTDFKISNRSVEIGEHDSLLSQHISSTKNIVLSYDLSAFSIEFLALNYTNSDKNQYAYRLEGFDKDWVYVVDRREATYTNLNSGTYTFKVKAANNDGVWNNEGAAISIVILPPWWETWWFRTLVVLLVLSVVYWFYKVRVDAIRTQRIEDEVTERTIEINKQKEELKFQKQKLEIQAESLAQMIFTKDKIFAVLGHDLRSPINSLMELIQLLTDKSINTHVLLMYIDRLKTNVRQVHFTLNNVLLWAKGQMHGLEINPQLLSLNSMVESNYNFVQEIAFAKRIELVNAVREDLTVWADSDHVDMVLRNLLSNALKFTAEEGKITVEAALKGNLCEISVKDTGMGMAREHIEKLFNPNGNFTTKGTHGERGTGLGLAICQEILELNEGKIWIESKIGIGTAVYFTLPLRNF